MRLRKPVTRLMAWILALLLTLGALPVALASDAEAPAETTAPAEVTQPDEKAALTDAREVMEIVTDTAPEDAADPLTVLDIPEAPYYTDCAYSENILFSGVYRTHRY